MGFCLFNNVCILAKYAQTNFNVNRSAEIKLLVVNLCYCFNIYTTFSKKNSQNCFCHNYVIFTPILIIFSTKMAKMIELCKMHSFSILPNSC